MVEVLVVRTRDAVEKVAGAVGEPPQRREEWGDYRRKMARGGGDSCEERRRSDSPMASEHGISSFHSTVCRLNGEEAAISVLVRRRRLSVGDR